MNQVLGEKGEGVGVCAMTVIGMGVPGQQDGVVARGTGSRPAAVGGGERALGLEIERV